VQVVAWPFLGHGRLAYNMGVALLAAAFLVYLPYFLWNRSRHARRRHGVGTPSG
jgi:hypothetical protein